MSLFCLLIFRYPFETISCAARNKVPVTKSVTRFRTVRKTVSVRKTRTSTVTLTASVANARRLAQRAAEPELELAPVDHDDSMIERSFDVQEFNSAVESAERQTLTAQDGHELFARNLCPACPAGQPVIAASQLKANTKPVFCCPGESWLSEA